MEPDLIIQEPPQVLKQYEVMQWDGTRENFKRIKEWAKPHNITIVGFASGKEYIYEPFGKTEMLKIRRK